MNTRGSVTYELGSTPVQGSEFAQMTFPDQLLQLGDSWEQDANTSPNAPVKAKTLYTLLRSESIGQHLCSVFHAQMAMPSVTTQTGGSAHGGTSIGEVWFAPELGQVVQTIATSNFSFSIPISEMGATAKTSTRLRTEMKLLKSGKSQ